LRERLLAVNQFKSPVAVTAGADGRTLEITWRYADAQWLDLMRVHKMRRTHKLVLALDEAAHKVRVREFWSAFDASAGPDGARFQPSPRSGEAVRTDTGRGRDALHPGSGYALVRALMTAMSRRPRPVRHNHKNN
jgi:hypothetical protein